MGKSKAPLEPTAAKNLKATWSHHRLSTIKMRKIM